MSLKRQFKAALNMARDVGFFPTLNRVWLTLNAKRLNHLRNAQFRRLKLGKPTERIILGSKMVLDPSRPGIDRDLLLDSIREPIATGYMMSLLRPTDTVLEVGANIGYYALLESKFCKKVYAVEPHPDNFRRLTGNIELNSRTNIQAFNLAFGASSGKLSMQCSVLSNWHTCRNVDSLSDNVIQVDSITIDDFSRTHDQPDIIKMDVEGFELEVLRGAKDTLHRVRNVFVELHGDILSLEEIRSVIDILSSAGLKPSLITQYDRPGLGKIYDSKYIERIYEGDRGTFELFFSRAN